MPRSTSRESRADELATAVARLEPGIDASPVIFELVSNTLQLSRAALFLADFPRGSFVPCASRGLGDLTAQAVTGRLESLFESDAVQPLSPQSAELFGGFAGHAGGLRVKPYLASDIPVALLVFAPPENIDDTALSATLARPELALLLRRSAEQLSEFPPLSLDSLEGVHPAGPSMLLSVSYPDTAAALSERAPSVSASWLDDLLQRMVARLLGPLGRVGVLSGSPVAVLTERSIDAEIVAHQMSMLLIRYLRSVRPLPPPVVVPSR